jgi:hypothetical protein
MSEKQTKIYLTNKETGEIVAFLDSERRIRRLRHRVGAWADCAKQHFNDRNKFITIMTTLTYRSSEDWRPDQIRDYMRIIKKFLGSYLIAYGWVAELQDRGAVHYHVLIVQRRGRILPKPDQAGFWTWGCTRVEFAKKQGYLMKYAQKCDTAEGNNFPPGLRLFAVVISKNFSQENLYHLFRLSTLPRWVWELYMEGGELGKNYPARLKGGWRIREEFHKSPWVLGGVRISSSA